MKNSVELHNEYRRLPPSLAKMMLAMFWFSLATNILLLAPTIHMLVVYDSVLGSGSLETLIYLTLIVLAGLAIYSIAEIVRTRIAHRVTAQYVMEYAEPVFDWLVHNRKPDTDPQEVLRTLGSVRQFLQGRGFIAVFDLPFFPIFLTLMFLLHITLGLVAVAGILALVGVAVLNNKLTKAARENSSKAQNEAHGFSSAVLSRAEDIRAMGLLPAILARWGDKTAASLNGMDEAGTHSARFFGLSRFVRQGLQTFVMAWGAFLVVNGQMSGGMIIASSVLLGRSLMPVEQLIGGWDAISNAYSGHKRICDYANQSANRPKLTRLPDPVGIVSVENLVYQPGAEEGRPPILDHVSFVLNPGEIMTVIGPSGAGKSTLSRLIVGAQMVTSGDIKLDGFELSQWPEDQRGQAIGYVPQDIMLFPGTVAENISRLDITPDDARVVNAANMAGVHELIASLPDGYSTMIGPGATQLSGGQRQRIALARAFYSNPKVLILDEPNAHLDGAGEEKLMNALVSAKERGVAVLIVTQRRAILKIADRVLIVEAGTARAMTKEEFIQSMNKGGNVKTPTMPGFATPPAQDAQTGGQPGGQPSVQPIAAPVQQGPALPQQPSIQSPNVQPIAVDASAMAPGPQMAQQMVQPIAPTLQPIGQHDQQQDQAETGNKLIKNLRNLVRQSANDTQATGT